MSKKNKKRDLTRQSVVEATIGLNDVIPGPTISVIDARVAEDRKNPMPDMTMNLADFLIKSRTPAGIKAGFKVAMKLRGETGVVLPQSRWDSLIQEFANSIPQLFIEERLQLETDETEANT